MIIDGHEDLNIFITAIDQDDGVMLNLENLPMNNSLSIGTAIQMISSAYMLMGVVTDRIIAALNEAQKELAEAEDNIEANIRDENMAPDHFA